LEYLSLFFFDGKEFMVRTLERIREQLLDLILSMKGLRGYRFISSSLCLIYDARRPHAPLVKLLDFGRAETKDPSFLDD
jgi:hypothetical protein